MTKEQWDKKWPMSNIPDSIREVVVAWSGHLFIEDKVKFAQDLLEATEKYRLEYATEQMVRLIENMSHRPIEVYSVKESGKDKEYFIGENYKNRLIEELKK